MRKRLLGWLMTAATATGAVAGEAQSPAERGGQVFAGGELEEYLRYQQSLGEGRLYPWAIRAFSAGEVTRIAPDSTHPWSTRYRFSKSPRGGVVVEPHPVHLRAVYNSAFPFGINDGPVWAGRGATASVQAGVSVTAGPVSATLAPVAFWTQNADFRLREGALSERLPLSDPLRPTQIDLPQRFGRGSYARVDPGQSFVRVDLLGVTAGLSTANQVWGPGTTFPIVLGNNAPGFLHAFAGTSRPWDLWIARVHGRLYWGRTAQSDFSDIPGDSSARFMSGIVGSVTPRGLPGLEIGGTRFFHTPWPAGGIGAVSFLKPFETFAKLDFDRRGREVFDAIATNQLASAFFRWVLPRSGFESYGEFAREDNSQNLRDFVAEPDHNSAYLLGFRKAWARSDDGFLAVRGEVVNAARSHLQPGRLQEPFYVHAITRQGHTSVGQLLGSPAAYAGAGSILAVERYRRDGRLTASWTRTFRQGELGSLAVEPTATDDPSNVAHALAVEALLFRGRLEWNAGVGGVYETNRVGDSDAFGLNLTMGVRASF